MGLQRDLEERYSLVMGGDVPAEMRQDREYDEGGHCSTCLWFRVDRNDLPYQGGTVLESEAWECELGYHCDCPPGTWQPKGKAKALGLEWVHDLLEAIREEEQQREGA